MLDRSSSKFKKHRFSYLFFFIVHVVFSCVIFGLQETVTVIEIVGIFLVGRRVFVVNRRGRLQAQFDPVVSQAHQC